MKTQKLIVIAAIVCLLAVFISGSAYAQAAEIIAEYLEEFQENSNETLRELENISRDLRQCFDEFEDCTDSFGRDKTLVECLSDFIPCTREESTDKQRTCTQFLREFRGDFRRSSRDARRAGVEEQFKESEAVRGTVVGALGIASLCY
jgi:sugar-specific transcriptional regulator TrmB